MATFTTTIYTPKGLGRGFWAQWPNFSCWRHRFGEVAELCVLAGCRMGSQGPIQGRVVAPGGVRGELGATLVAVANVDSGRKRGAQPRSGRVKSGFGATVGNSRPSEERGAQGRCCRVGRCPRTPRSAIPGRLRKIVRRGGVVGLICVQGHHGP